jgi:hypothetical protein
MLTQARMSGEEKQVSWQITDLSLSWLEGIVQSDIGFRMDDHFSKLGFIQNGRRGLSQDV